MTSIRPSSPLAEISGQHSIHMANCATTQSPLSIKRECNEPLSAEKRCVTPSEFRSNYQGDSAGSNGLAFPLLTGLGIQMQHSDDHYVYENHTTTFQEDYCKLITSEYYPEPPMDMMYDYYPPHQNGPHANRVPGSSCPPSGGSPSGDTDMTGNSSLPVRYRHHPDPSWVYSSAVSGNDCGTSPGVNAQPSGSMEFSHRYSHATNISDAPLPASIGPDGSRRPQMSDGVAEYPQYNFSGPSATGISMYDPAYVPQDRSLCVNPADVMSDVYEACINFQVNTSSSASSSLDSSQSTRGLLINLEQSCNASLTSLDQEIEIVLPPLPQPMLMDMTNEVRSINGDHHGPLVYDFSQNHKQNSDADDYEPSPQPCSSPSVGSSPFPSPPKRRAKSRMARGRIAKVNPKPMAPVVEEVKTDDYVSIILGTPVLDAHRGISLEELESKAERYRLRNAGADYDKRWLLSFAGKLTARGELLDEYRCYVNGCTQTNKRRDHILIHLGAHLDQRPFRCSYWYVYWYVPACCRGLSFFVKSISIFA